MFTWHEEDLTDEQDAAVRQPGHVFLVACPGSGKTRTLTYKAAYELSRLESAKRFVVAITYTHRAADEIKERIEALGVDTTQLWIGTIHSFCLEWILKPYQLYHPQLREGFSVIDPYDAEERITELCKPYKAHNITFFDCAYYLTPDAIVVTSSDSRKRPLVRLILKRYFDGLTADRLIDFELMLRYAHELIQLKPAISRLLSHLFAHLLVDEYQDTKKIQYDIVSAILRAGAGRTLSFVVGDPNQAIFTGLGGYAINADVFAAQAGIAQNFRKLLLSGNYRSSKRIIDYYGHFNVHATTIAPSSRDAAYPSEITMNDNLDREQLDEELERLIRHNIEIVGIAPHEVCILAPWWNHLGYMTRRLVERMPQYLFDGPGMVPFSRNLDNFWFKLSKIVLTTASPTMYVRRIRWAHEIISDLAAAGATPDFDAKALLRASNGIQCTETDGLTFLAMAFDELFEALSLDRQLYPALEDHHTAFFESADKRIQRIAKEGSAFISHVDTFRKVFQLRSGITISTIHGIKGDEYDAVIAYGLLEGMVPNAADAEGDVAAKKLLYVIASRARKNLHLISERGRRKYGGGEYQTTAVLDRYNFRYDAV